jgi:hypothetical protein
MAQVIEKLDKRSLQNSRSMKGILKNPLILLMVVLSANHAIGQGEVYFGNRVLPPARLVLDSFGQPIVGTNFIAQLLYETTPETFIAHPEIARFYPSAEFQGWWVGGFRNLAGAGGVNVPVRMQIRAWDGGFGGTTEIPSITFDEAVIMGNQWGVSEIFVYTQEQDGPDPDDFWMKNFQGFSLVPEPSAWALFALGMGCLVWRHRKRGMRDGG